MNHQRTKAERAERLRARNTIIDAATGEEVSRGYVPDYCVAVSAQRKREYPGGEFYLPCVLIIKRLDENERHSKVALNSLLRDHGVAT